MSRSSVKRKVNQGSWYSGNIFSPPSFRKPDQRLLLPPRPGFDRRFTLQGRTSAGVRLLVDLPINSSFTFASKDALVGRARQCRSTPPGVTTDTVRYSGHGQMSGRPTASDSKWIPKVGTDRVSDHAMSGTDSIARRPPPCRRRTVRASGRTTGSVSPTPYADMF